MAVNLDQESVKMNVREVVAAAIISTLFIGVPCSQATRLIPDDLTIGEWDTEHRIYVLKQDVSEPLEVVQSGLVLDGSGHKVIGGGIGSGVGIKVVGRNGVTVKNIVVENWDVGIHVESSIGARLVENVCTNNFQGIRLDVSSDNELMGNTCSDSRREMYGSGIILHESGRNLIRGNETRGNYSWGIILEAGSTGNRLESNTITGGTYQGIALSNSPGNNITGNQSTGNTYGVQFAFSDGNVFSQNTVSNNRFQGIGLHHSNGNTVTQNTATGNFQGIRLNSSNDNQLIGNTCSDSRREINGSGVYLHDSHRNIVRGNEARNNYSFGIFLEAGSGGNRVEGNTITGGTYQGISLKGALGNIITGNQSTGNTYGIVLASSSDGNVLTQNTVSDNLIWGIGIHLSNNNKIYNNNLIANSGYQAYVDRSSGANIFSLPEYGGNYWSDHTEPNIDADPRFVDTPYLFPEDQKDGRPWVVKDGWREPPVIAQNMIDRVKELVTIGSLNEGQGNSLTKKLDGFIKQLQKRKTKTALNQLNAFINHVRSLIAEGVLSSDEGQPLIDGANTIVSNLSEGVAKLATVPPEPSLSDAYPNPFNPSTTIRYALPEGSEVRLTIYNIVGQQVQVLVDDIQEAGVHTAVWDGRDAAGRTMAAGVYLYRLEVGQQVVVRKMTFAK